MSCKFVSTMLHGTHRSQTTCGMISWFLCTRMFGSCHGFHLEILVETRMVSKPIANVETIIHYIKYWHTSFTMFKYNTHHSFNWWLHVLFDLGPISWWWNVYYRYDMLWIRCWIPKVRNKVEVCIAFVDVVFHRIPHLVTCIKIFNAISIMNKIYSILNYIRLAFIVHLFNNVIKIIISQFNILYKITSDVWTCLQRAFISISKIIKFWCHFLHGSLKESRFNPQTLSNMNHD